MGVLKGDIYQSRRGKSTEEVMKITCILWSKDRRNHTHKQQCMVAPVGKLLGLEN